MMRLIALFVIVSLTDRPQGDRPPANLAGADDDLVAYVAVGGVT